MFRLRQLGAVIAVVLCASTVGLSGQQSQPSQQEVTVAPEPGWTFVPGVIAGAMYDSNVLVTTSVTETGEPASDTYFTIDPTGIAEVSREAHDASTRTIAAGSAVIRRSTGSTATSSTRGSPSIGVRPSG